MGPWRQSPQPPRLPLAEEGLESNPNTATTRRQIDNEIAFSLARSLSKSPTNSPPLSLAPVGRASDDQVRIPSPRSLFTQIYRPRSTDHELSPPRNRGF